MSTKSRHRVVGEPVADVDGDHRTDCRDHGADVVRDGEGCEVDVQRCWAGVICGEEYAAFEHEVVALIGWVRRSRKPSSGYSWRSSSVARPVVWARRRVRSMVNESAETETTLGVQRL